MIRNKNSLNKYCNGAIVIGAGRMGIRHIYAIETLKLNLLGIIDKSKKKLLEYSDKSKYKKKTFNNLKHYLKNNLVPDCAIIATTGDSHYKIAKELLVNGIKKILIEKPVVTSIADWRKLKKLSIKYKATLAVNHQMRFMEHYILIKKLINSNRLGELTSMNIIAGNIGLAMNLSHYIEAFRFITGDKVKNVQAWFSKKNIINPRGKKFKDKSGCLRMESKNKKRIYVDISSDQGHGVNVIYCAKHGFIYSDEINGKLRVAYRKTAQRKLHSNFYGLKGKIIEKKIKPKEVVVSSGRVLKSLIQNKNTVTLEDGLESILPIIAAYISNENKGRKVSINEANKDTRKFPWA